MTSDRDYRRCATPGEAETAVRALTATGWRLARDFRLPPAPWDLSGARIVAAGVVTDPDVAQAALLAAVRGTALVLALPAGTSWESTDWARGLSADLERLLRQREPTAISPADNLLTKEQRDVLDLLVEGESIATTARRLFLSLRTTNRRVAEARAALGVETTREAVLTYADLTGKGR
ncbi:MAG: hypothetical protein ACR2F6_10455 [Mycobacteriales bacterium]